MWFDARWRYVQDFDSAIPQPLGYLLHVFETQSCRLSAGGSRITTINEDDCVVLPLERETFLPERRGRNSATGPLIAEFMS